MVLGRSWIPTDPRRPWTPSLDDSNDAFSEQYIPKHWPTNTTFGDWKLVTGMSGVFASSLGYVVTWDGRHKRWFEPRKGNDGGYGYYRTKIHRKDYRVHILVCLAFHGNGQSGQTVDHINRNKSDNRACNLRWASTSEQVTNRSSAKRRRDGNPVWVWKVGSEQSTAVLYTSVYSASAVCGAHASLLRKTAIGEYSQTAGFHARFAEDSVETIHGEIFRQWGNISVSQFGRMKTFNGKFLRPMALDGHLYATYNNQLFHRIVAFVWPDIVGVQKTDDATIDHINRDKSDNRACNLRWATKAEQRANQCR